MPDDKNSWATLTPEALAFMEVRAEQLLREHLDAAEATRKEGQQILALMLAGAGGSLGLAAAASMPFPAAVGFVVTSLYLFLVAAVLSYEVIRCRDMPSLGNVPSNLLEVWKDDMRRLRCAELRSLEERINQAVEASASRASLVDHCRLAASLTPAPFVVGTGLGYLLG